MSHPSTSTTTTTTSARAAARPGQKEDRTMTTAKSLAPVVSLDELEERRERAELIERAELPDYYATRFEDLEAMQPENFGTSIDAIVDRVLRRPDSSIDLERVARLTVAAALRADQHVFDHEENPWWERLA